MRSSKLRVVFIVAISVIMSALRTFIIANNMENSAKDAYYLPESLEVTAFSVVSALILCICLYLAFAFGRNKTVKLDRAFSAVPAGSLVLAFSLIFAVATFINDFIKAEVKQASAMDVIVILLSVLTAVKFLWSGLFYNYKVKNESAHAVAALLPIFLSIFRILSDFVRASAAPTASSGAYHILGLVSVLLYFLVEGSSFVKKANGTLYYALGYISVYLLLVYALPNLILHCFVFCFNPQTSFSIVDIGIAIYVASRLSSAQLLDKEDLDREEE